MTTGNQPDSNSTAMLIRVNESDVFCGMIYGLVLRGGISAFNPDKYGQQGYAFDNACHAVFEIVAQACVDQDLDLRFRVFLDPVFGTSQLVREQIGTWQMLGITHIRLPYDGLIHINVNEDLAEMCLRKICERTTFTREFFIELASEFLRVYRGETERV